MASINNHFPVTLTSVSVFIYLTFLSLLVLLSPNTANAADPLFTIENVKVDVTAENAIAAREKAFDEAQVKAFQELTLRMIPETDLATSQMPPVQTISTMINDFELTNEQLSAVRYIGTYTFRFKDRDVRRYFAQKGVTYSDVSSQALLVLPFFKINAANQDRTILWTPGNSWMQAWNRVPNLSGLVPLEVPLGDLSDVRDISDDQALSYDPEGLQNLLNRYKSSEAVIAIATPDTTLAQITNLQDIAQGRLNIEIYRTDSYAPELVQQVSAVSDGAMSVEKLYDRGVMLVRSALQKDWKTKTAIAANPSLTRVNVVLPIEVLSDWLKVQAELNRMTSLNSVVLKSLTPRQANVEIAYQGGEERLALTLAQVGLEIVQTTASDGSSVNVLTPVRYQPVRF